MGLDSCMKCIKYTLFIFNFFFWLVGVGILALGLYLLIMPIAAVGQVLGKEDPYHCFRLTFIVVGSVIMLLGFLGCCGAILENKCMLLTFFIIMTLVFLALVVTGLLLVFMKVEAKEELVNGFETTLNSLINSSASEPGSENNTKAFHDLFSCCGIRKGLADFKDRGAKEPESCKGRNEPCVPKFEKQLENNWLIAVIVVFSVASITLIGMVLSMLLCCALREDYDY